MSVLLDVERLAYERYSISVCLWNFLGNFSAKIGACDFFTFKPFESTHEIFGTIFQQRQRFSFTFFLPSLKLTFAVQSTTIYKIITHNWINKSQYLLKLNANTAMQDTWCARCIFPRYFNIDFSPTSASSVACAHRSILMNTSSLPYRSRQPHQNCKKSSSIKINNNVQWYSFVLCTGECRACVHRASSLLVFTRTSFHFSVCITFLLNITTDASAERRCLSLPIPPTTVMARHDGIIAYTNFTFFAHNNAK